MRKKLFGLATLFLISCIVTAHEFWLEPDRFYFKPGEQATINFRVGENFLGDGWKVKTDRIVRLEHHFGSRAIDLKGEVTDNAMDPFTVSLLTEGSHTVVMETNPAFINLDGKAFTEYLEEDGLDDILYERKKTGITTDSASELYSRHTKLILQSGGINDEHFRTTYNLPIEIVPGKNPATLKKGESISFKILFNGQPLFGAKVKVWNRYNHRTSVQNIFSQQDGVIETHVSNPGAWMVSVVKMVPSTDGKAKYRSYWGSLVFGVKP